MQWILSSRHLRCIGALVLFLGTHSRFAHCRSREKKWHRRPGAWIYLSTMHQQANAGGEIPMPKLLTRNGLDRMKYTAIIKDSELVHSKLVKAEPGPQVRVVYLTREGMKAVQQTENLMGYMEQHHLTHFLSGPYIRMLLELYRHRELPVRKLTTKARVLGFYVTDLVQAGLAKQEKRPLVPKQRGGRTSRPKMMSTITSLTDSGRDFARMLRQNRDLVLTLTRPTRTGPVPSRYFY